MKSAGTKLLTLMLIGVLAFFMPGCGGDDDNDNDHVVTLQSIQVQPVDEPAEGTTDLYPLVKGNVEYEAIGVYSDGTTKVMTTEAAWSTEDDAVATAEVNGHVKFVDGGQTQVVAKVGDVSGKASLRIEALEKITLMKKSGLPSQIPAGVSVQYKAIGETTSGYTFDVSAYVDWQSSDEKIAKVEFVYPETVLRAVPQKSPVIVKVKTLAKGDATISAKVTTPAGKALEDAKEMAVSDAALLKLQIDQSDMSKPVGTTVQLSATGLFSDGTVIPLTTEVAWSSSDTSVVSIDKLGKAQTLKTGDAKITAKYGSQNDAIDIHVTAATLQSITVTPADSSTVVGLSETYKAVGNYSDNTQVDITKDVTWSSSNIAVAKMDGNVARAVGAGEATITASLGGVTSNGAKLSVTKPTLTKVVITSGDVTVPAGTLGSFKATGEFDNGEVLDITGHVSWTSSDTSVVTIDKFGNAQALKAGEATVTAKYGDQSDTVNVHVTAATLESIAIHPSVVQLPIHATQAFTVMGTYSDGSIVDITKIVSFGSSDTNVVKVTGNIAKAVAQGSADITATAGTGIEAVAKVTVPEATLQKVQLTFSDGTTAKKVPVGVSGGIEAVAYYDDGSVLEITDEVTAISSDSKVVGVDKGNRLIALSEGTAEITVNYQGVKSNALTLNVASANVVLKSIVVSPANLTLPIDGHIAYNAKGSYSDGSVVDITHDVNWNSSDSNVATMAGNEATAVGAGKTTISAKLGDVVGQTALNVSEATLQKVQLTFKNGETDVTVPKGTTGSLIAIAYYSDGSSHEVTPEAQFVYDTKVVDVHKGSVAAVGVGESEITAKYGGLASNPVHIAVTDAKLESITLSPSDSTMSVGETVQFVAEGRYSDGSVQDITKDVSWQSSDPAVASVDMTGLVKANAEGTATVTASLEGVSASGAVQVKAAEVASLQLTFKNGKTSVEVPVGTTGGLVAMAIYSDGSSSDVTDEVHFTYNADVVDVQKGGFVKALATGTSDIVAKYGTVSSNKVEVKVVEATLTEIQVQPAQVALYVGEQQQMMALGTFSDGTIRDITADVVWESKDVKIASVNMKGLITATGEGVVNVEAHSADDKSVKDIVRVVVSLPQLTSINIVEDDSSALDGDNEFIVGETLKLKALGDFDDGTKNRDITRYVTWTPGPEGTVSVNQNGLVTALKAGDASVTAAYNGAYGNASDKITGKVVAKTVSEILIFSDPADTSEVPVGNEVRLEAWALYNDGTNQNVSDTVKWTSDNSNVSVIVPKGEKYAIATATEEATAKITALHESGRSNEKEVTFHGKIPDHIEIQEGYCGDGDCPVITGKTIDIPIVDRVDYENKPEGVYYPTAWLVYSDGSKEYINDRIGIRWWSADQIRAYVNTTKGSFVFGRGLGEGIEISVSYRGEHKTSFFVNVVEDTTTKTLTQIGILNTQEAGWGCTQNDADYGEKLSMLIGDEGKYLMACGKFRYSDGTIKWEDINNNVAWFSSDSKVARVQTSTGELKALGGGNAVITAQLAEIKGAIDVEVVDKTPDHIEIQEGYCEDGKCPVITGTTVRIPIVDDVEYDPVSLGAYYPTAWLVFTDGTKQYINTTSGIRWWSADQIRAYVNTLRGSFVFGRGIGNGIEISVSYRGEYKTSFFVDVYEDTSEKTLRKIGIKNVKDLGWGCTQNDADYGTKLTVKASLMPRQYLQACGQFEYANGTIKWEDINNNVAWLSSDRDIAYVRTTTGKLKAIKSGNAVISAQLAEIKGQIDVDVVE